VELEALVRALGLPDQVEPCTPSQYWHAAAAAAAVAVAVARWGRPERGSGRVAPGLRPWGGQRLADQRRRRPEFGTTVIGTHPHQQTETRTAERNGYLPWTVTTTAGDLDLKIQTTAGRIVLPVPAEPSRRLDQSLFGVIMEVDLRGTSTGKGPMT